MLNTKDIELQIESLDISKFQCELKEIPLAVISNILNNFIQIHDIKFNNYSDKGKLHSSILNFVSKTLWKDKLTKKPNSYISQYNRFFPDYPSKNINKVFNVDKSFLNPNDQTIEYFCDHCFHSIDPYYLSITKQAFNLRKKTIYPTLLNILASKKIIDNLPSKKIVS